MDMWFTLMLGERNTSGTGLITEKPFVRRECFLTRCSPRPKESIKKTEGVELHRLLDEAIEEVNGVLERANSVL